MSLIPFLSSRQGRIDRKTYWITSFILPLVYLIVSGPFYALADRPTFDEAHFIIHMAAVAVVVLLTGVLVYTQACVAIKRLHDRDKPGWWLILAFVPFLGPFYLLADCAILRGTDGDNRFGPKPVKTGRKKAAGLIAEGS